MQILCGSLNYKSFTQASVSFRSIENPCIECGGAVRNISGARLLQRTTRTVRLTQDGQSCYERCKSLLAEFQELESLFNSQAEQVSGRLRVDMSTGIARNLCSLNWLNLLSNIRISSLKLSSTDRKVDVIAEGLCD